MIIGIVAALLAVVLLGSPSLAAWRQLARIYPDRRFAVNFTFRAVSGHVGGTLGAVQGCLRVEVGEAGLRISTWPLLRRLLPPVMLPWSEVIACSLDRYYLSPQAARLDLARWPQPIYLWPRLWRDEHLPNLLQNRWHERTKAL